MPELPDVELYREALTARIAGARLMRVDVLNPFLVRTAVPPLDAATGKRVLGVRRIGKRIVLSLEDDLHIVIHLMIAGRLRWLAEGAKPPGRITLAVFHFDTGRLAFTEAGSKRRASVHVVHGDDALATFDMGGLEIATLSFDAFDARLTSENHTLNRARLSPLALTSKLDVAQRKRLFDAAREVLREWTRRLADQAHGAFPDKVTAFRPEMAVHGRYGQPCPVCAAPVQRIVYAQNECNYCAVCQTGGTLLADRALSRLLHASWPRSIDELG